MKKLIIAILILASCESITTKDENGLIEITHNVPLSFNSVNDTLLKNGHQVSAYQGYLPVGYKKVIILAKRIQ